MFFGCCAVAQALQTQMESWRQRTRLLVDEIHKIDPYYSFPSELTPRVTGLASYADIAARRMSPSSRDSSPYRAQQEFVGVQTHQIHRPQVIRPQVPQQVPQIPQIPQVSLPQISEPEEEKVERDSKKKRRGRSPTRNNRNQKVPEIKVANKEVVQEHVQTREYISANLAPKDTRRRSPSPIWIPGSTSYADILRKAQGPGSYTTDSEHEYGMTTLTKERRVSVGSAGKSMEDIRVEKPVDHVSQDQNLQERWSQSNTLNQYSIPSNQMQTEIYEYNAAMPDVVDIGIGVSFFNPGLGYPVGSYVYPAGQQQMEVALNPYDPHIGYAEHYVTQQNYMTAGSPDIYSQTHIQCPQSEMIYYNSEIFGEGQVCQSQVQDHVSVVDSAVSLPTVNETIDRNESVEVRDEGKVEDREVEQVTEARGSGISYAKILSQGLPERTPSPVKLAEETLVHEIAKPAKFLRKIESEPDDGEDKKRRDDRNWGTIKKSKKKGMEEKKVEKVKEGNKKVKKGDQVGKAQEKIGEVCQVVESKKEKIDDKVSIKEDKVQVDDDKLTKEDDKVQKDEKDKKRKNKKKKDKSREDEIDKALKEIANLDKQKVKDKVKEKEPKPKEIEKKDKEEEKVEKNGVEHEKIVKEIINGKVEEKKVKGKKNKEKVLADEKVKQDEEKVEFNLGEVKVEEKDAKVLEEKEGKSKKQKKKKDKQVESEKVKEEVIIKSVEEIKEKVKEEEKASENKLVHELKQKSKDDKSPIEKVKKDEINKVTDEKTNNSGPSTKQKKKKGDKSQPKVDKVDVKDSDVKSLPVEMTKNQKPQNKPEKQKSTESSDKPASVETKSEKTEVKLEKTKSTESSDKPVAVEIKSEKEKEQIEKPKSQPKVEKDSKDSDKKSAEETKKETSDKGEIKVEKPEMGSKKDSDVIKQEEAMKIDVQKKDEGEMKVLEKTTVQSVVETKQKKKKGDKSQPKIDKINFKDSDVKSLPVEITKDQKPQVKVEKQKSMESSDKPASVETKSEKAEVKLEKTKSIESSDKPVAVATKPEEKVKNDKSKTKQDKGEKKIEKSESIESKNEAVIVVETTPRKEKIKDDKQKSTEATDKPLPVEMKQDKVKNEKVELKTEKSVEIPIKTITEVKDKSQTKIDKVESKVQEKPSKSSAAEKKQDKPKDSEGKIVKADSKALEDKSAKSPTEIKIQIKDTKLLTNKSQLETKELEQKVELDVKELEPKDISQKIQVQKIEIESKVSDGKIQVESSKKSKQKKKTKEIVDTVDKSKPSVEIQASKEEKVQKIDEVKSKVSDQSKSTNEPKQSEKLKDVKQKQTEKIESKSIDTKPEPTKEIKDDPVKQSPESIKDVKEKQPDKIEPIPSAPKSEPTKDIKEDTSVQQTPESLKDTKPKIKDSPAKQPLESPKVTRPKETKLKNKPKNQPQEQVIVEKIAPTYVVETKEIKSDRKTNIEPLKESRIRVGETKHSNGHTEAKKEVKCDTGVKSEEQTVSKTASSISQIDKSVIQSSENLKDKALITEKTVTTVTTSEVLSSTVGAEKSVEILETVLPISTEKKREEIITLCPDSVEANLTTTYVVAKDPIRVPKDEVISTSEVNTKSTEKSISDILLSNMGFKEDDAPLFGSVQDRKNTRSKTESTSSYETDQYDATKHSKEREMKVDEVRDQKIETSDDKLKCIAEDFNHPYWADYETYREAEKNLYQNFKVVKVIEPQTLSSSKPTSSTQEKIVQESFLAKEIEAENKLRDFDLTKAKETHNVKEKVIEVKQKSDKKDEGKNKVIKDSKKNSETSNVIVSEVKKEVKEEPKIHLVADDSWMDILDEPMVIDDDFDDENVESVEKVSEKAKELKEISQIVEKPTTSVGNLETQSSTTTSRDSSKKSKKQKKKNNVEKQKESEKISDKKDNALEKENLQALGKSFAEVLGKSATPSPQTVEEIKKPEGIIKPEAMKPEVVKPEVLETKKSQDKTEESDEAEGSWAAIAAKKVEVPENVLPAVKSVEKMDHPKPSVQIVVEEVVMEPIENLVQVDEQGFMEYVNRKELRSRRSRSRSRSRSNRRENAPEVRSADGDQKAVDGTQEESLVDNVKVEKLSETKEEIKVVESQQVPKGKSKQKKKQKDKEMKAEGGKVQGEKVEKVDEKPEVVQPAKVETTKVDEKPDVLTAKVESTKSETQPLKVEDKKSEPQNKKGDKSKKSKEQAKKMTEVKKPEDKKPEVKPETAGTQKSEESAMPVVTTEEKVEPKDQPKKPDEKAPEEVQKPEEKKPAVQAKKSGKKESKKPAAQPEKSTGKPEQQKQPEKQVQKPVEKPEQLKKVDEHVEKLKDKPEQRKKADEEVKKSLDKPEQSKKVEEQVEKLKDKSEPSKKTGEKVQKSENKKPESPKIPVEQKPKETVTIGTKVDDKKKEPEETVCQIPKKESNVQVQKSEHKKPESPKKPIEQKPKETVTTDVKKKEPEVTSCAMPKEKSKDKKKNKKAEKTPVEVPKKSNEPEISKKVEIPPELPSEPAIKESDPPAQDQSLTSEDSKDSGFCVITSESETAEFTHESSLLRDMVVVPPMDSPSAPPTEPPPQSRSPLPKSKGTSNLMSRNSASSASLEHCSIEICETPSSKVQFYIDEDDDIVVISHATEEEASPLEISSKQDRPSSYEALKFISCDSIWLDKRAYHDAERDFFAEKSSKLKQKVSTIKHSYDPRDDDDKNNDKGRKGPKDPSFDAHSGSSTPKTERLVADLPGGIGSWNDYSTYLSLEQDPSRVDPRDHNPHSKKFSVVPNLSSSLYQTISLPLSSSSFSTSTCSNYHLSSSQAHPSIQHLGTEISGSTKQLSSTNDQELPVTTIAVDNDPVHGYKESLESSVENLEVIVSRLEESLSSLPRDSLENMLSALAVILGELRKHDQRSNEIQKELDKIEAIEGEKLIAPVTRLRERIAGLIDQVEQGIAALGKAREIKHQREQQVALYKTFLEETDSWLRNLVLMISQQQSVLSYQTLLSELEARNQRMNELETLPEVSELARSLRAALLETYTRLKQKQQEIEEDESAQASEELADHDDITLDQAPSIHSGDEGTMSWADVSLQTGQSLIIDHQNKPIQLTKQTSTSQIAEFDVQTEPLEMQSIPIQVSIDEGVKSTQESIKIYKTADDTHEVIEIATKNIPASSSSQFILAERSADDIVVDMKYQDAKAQQSATSELSIQHAAPQTFETVLTEPDDVTTEVVVDADGTKRIIVRKLRRTLVRSQQITSMDQVSVSGDQMPQGVQAFSEATMRSQQVTVTRTRPDGSVEMAAKETYGGKITTGGAPGEVVSVEQFETTPQYSHRVIRGEIEDIGPELGGNVTIEEGAYQTKTSTVHAMVQQVTRRVIRKTRRTIRKVTIIDGKETMSEEVVEEPDEVEIDEQDIPHISINVVKQEEQKTFVKDDSVRQVSKATEIDSSLQGPFFGPTARELTPDGINIEDKPIIEEIIDKDGDQLKEIEEKSEKIEKEMKKDVELEEIKVNDTTSINISQKFIDVEKSELLQSASGISGAGVDSSEAREKEAELPITDAKAGEEVAENTCKCMPVEVPAVMTESFNMKLDTGTVEVVQHADDSSTVVGYKEPPGKQNIVVLESQESSLPSVDHASPAQSPSQPSDLHTHLGNLDGASRDSKAIIDKVEISLMINKSLEGTDEAGAFVAVKTTAERPDDVCRITEENVDIRLPTQVEIVEVVPDKIVQTSALESFEPDQVPAYKEPEKSDAETSSSRKSRKKKRRKDEDTGGKSSEESGSSVATTIAESVDLNLPISESPKQVSEQPQPDVLEITETSLTLSSPRETSMGYEPEDVTTVDEASLILEKDLGKKKKKKKRKQRFNGDENDEDDEGKTKEKDVREIETSEPVKELGKKKFIEIDTQTVYETRDVSASPVELQSLRDTSLLTSPEAKQQQPPMDDSVGVVERMQTITTEIQTSPTEVLDTEIQTEIGLLEKELLDVQTETKEVAKEEEAVQTSPVEQEEPAGLIVVGEKAETIKTEEIDVQTVQTETTEAHTSPIEAVAMTEIDTQTEVQEPVDEAERETPRAKETQDNEQQTSPVQFQDSVLEETGVQTSPELGDLEVESVKTVEIDVQTSSPDLENANVTKGDFEVQANLIEEVTVAAIETQTTPRESPKVEEIEVQTTVEPTVESVVQTSPEPEHASEKCEVVNKQKLIEEVILEKRDTVEEESQTTPEKIETQDSFVQIQSQELIPTVEEGVQSIPDAAEVSLQTLESFEETEDKETALKTATMPEIRVFTKETASSPIKELREVEKTAEVVQERIVQKIPEVDSLVTKKVEEMPVRRAETPEKELTDTSSFEIHVQATIDLSDNTITESAQESESTDVTHDTISEDLSEVADLAIDKARKRSKKKSKKKTVKPIDEITRIEKDNHRFESVVSQSGSKETVMKLTYSDVTRKGSKEREIVDEQNNVSVGRITTDLDLRKVEHQQKRDSDGQEVKLKATFESEPRESFKVKETIVGTSSKGDEFAVSMQVQKNIARRRDRPSMKIEVPEPMDTDEEVLSPMESVLAKKEVKTYAEVAESGFGSSPLTNKSTSEQFIAAEKQDQRPQVLQQTQTAKVVVDRLKNLQNVNETSYLTNILHIASLEDFSRPVNAEERVLGIQKNLSQLKHAIEERNVIIVEETLVTIVEIISTWLETIEYRVFVSREATNGPSHEDTRMYVELKDEINHVEDSIEELRRTWKLMENAYPADERDKVNECMDSLVNQVKAIENATRDEERYVTAELSKWDEFLNGVDNIYRLVLEQFNELNIIIESTESTAKKLEELDKLENTNRSHMCNTNKLIASVRDLLKSYPGRSVPDETYQAHELTMTIEHNINVERERLLQLMSVAEEYEQTLQDFAQITDVAEDLLASPISVMSLEHLQDEMQKHRKFFVNLNHCRAILESLEDNLDIETRTKHAEFHENLHSRAGSLLDRAASRAQQMSLAASKWIVLEQGFKEERGWLQIVHQRVPDLQTVTSSDYDQYISLYQSLSSDIAIHQARLHQLFDSVNILQELLEVEDLDERYRESLDVIAKLQEDVDSSLRSLLTFRDSWSTHEVLTNRLENWMATTERELDALKDNWDGHMRQFWEIKAQYEIHNNLRNEAVKCFEQGLHVIPLSDEMIQRQFHGEFQDRWHRVSGKIKTIQRAVADTISSEDTPINEKLRLLERELNELRTTVEGFHGVLKTEDELELYVGRLSVLFERVCIIQDELVKLGMLPAAESEQVSVLLSFAGRMESQIREELDAAQLVQERLQALQRGLARVRKAHTRQSMVLDQCEACERHGSDVVEGGVKRCSQVADELAVLWKDLMGLRQLLHTVPGGMRVSVSPVSIERDISTLQDVNTDLESRCAKLLALLKSRLSLWRRFERQLEMVQQSVQEADHMMKVLAIQGSVDYDRLLKATEHLEGLNGDLGARESWVEELRAAAEPLLEVCTSEVSERVNAAVNEAVQAWEDTRSELGELCTKYQHAVRLWEQYRDSSAAVKAWVDTQMGSITNLPPEEALKQVKVCEETLAEHKERLAELRGLVAQIASDVGLDSNGPLHCEIEALGRRLEDVRETLSTLADTADARALNQELTRGDLCQTKNFLDSVQQSLITVGQGESKEQLNLLRNHLLALTRTEPQLQSIKDRALDVTTTETSVVDVLQLWQRVFRETFQQYHRLSARLVRSEDVAAALRLWQEYLSHVQDFLSNDMPGDYNGLSEHRNLCEVHKNLLTDQQHLILSIRAEKGRDLSVAEQFNILTNLHNETLSKIMDRHASVRDRLAAWDKYKLDQSKLLSWLKEIEREKSRLQLRFIHVRRLDKIITKIESLLEKVPTGEAQINSLSVQQDSLLNDCEEALAVSIRMEHAANTQRITNLRASLETWRDFVLRIRKLNEQHVEQTAIITKRFQDISQTISAAFHNSSSNLQHVKQQLDSLQQLRAKLNEAPSHLEALGVTTEQLRECLSPSDMKSLNQHNSLLWQQHGDLEHQLALLVYKLGERLSLRGKWDKRLTRFFVWVTDAETRINSCDSSLEEPEEALKRLEGELHAEMALKQRELDWLQTTGLELVDIADKEDGELIQRSLDDINERWARLLNAGKARTTKLLDLMQTMNLLEKSIAEIRGWLGKVELQLTEAFVIESKTQKTIDKKLEDHEMLQKTIEDESGKIGEVLNLCEILLNDCDAWKASFNTEPIKSGMKGLEKRWKSTCVRSAERKRKIIIAWKLVQELDKVKQEQEQWIADVEKELLGLEEGLDKTSKEGEQILNKTRRVLKDIDAHKPALVIIEQSYSRLAKSGLEPENFKALTVDVRLLLDRWQALKPRANSIISALRREQKAYREFITAHGSAVVGLTQVDVKLTQVQHLEQKVSVRRRLQQIMEIEKELAVQSRTLQRADELALIVMQDCAPNDVPAIQELVDEYQLLWQDIKSRVATLKTQFEESSDKMEVDEAVQVETLKFEQDSAVQVDTLPRLTRMTSCDAYLIELQSALSECRNALEELEDAITPEPTPGPGLASTAKNIAKLMGSCQSAIELAKHLHGLLTADGKLNDEVAKTVEVNDLSMRYESTVVRARAREQQIREIRSPLVNAYSLPCEHDQGRLTCPLCSRRNWAQLDIDLWRLEKWLEYAEGIQSEQSSPPSNIEDLEDIIQDHREFLLDLDSHKSIVISLNIVGSHLADHTEDVERAQELRDRLATANSRWERVCSTARTWQSALQSALMGNQQFHRIVEELLSWLERTENSIQANEPIDLADNVDVIKSKYNKFRELRSDLERCEPRVVSLEESAHHLLDESMEIRGRLHELKLRLQSLRRLTGIYALKLGAALGLDPKEVGLAATSSSLASLSNDLLDGASSTTSLHGQSSSNDGDERDRTVLVRGYRFLGRVLRASLPIQALMLLLLGVASLVPTAEDDYSCMLSNNIARTFTPVVEYPNGPPPL